MGNTLRRFRELGFATAMLLASALVFGTLAPASAVEATGSISGTVTQDANGGVEPASSVYVSVYTSDYDWVDNAETDENGDYSIGSLPDGSYVVEFSPASSRHLSEFYKNAPDFATATRVDTSGGAAVSGVDANLEGWSTISGTVMRDIDGVVSPAETVRVRVYSAADNRSLTSTDTAADGSYSFDWLTAGSYKVGFSGTEGTSPSVQNEYFDDVSDLTSAASIEVGAGTTVSGIDATLAQGSSITGTVTTVVDSAVVPAANVQVDAYSAISGDYVASSQVDDDGRYAIGSLTEGSYKLFFYSYGAGFLSEYFDNAADLDAALAIEVGAHATVSGIDAVLDQASTLSGTVSQSDDGVVSGAANVSIDVYSANGDTVTNGQTDADGSYSIGSLPAGSYKLGFRPYAQGSNSLPEFYDDAADLGSAQTIVVGYAATVSGLDATLAQGGTISGTVSQEPGGVRSAASGVSVRAYTADGHNDVGSVATDADGHYSINSLPAGSFTLHFYSYGGDGSNLLSEWWDNASDFNSATPIEVTLGATVSGKDATLTQGSTISGTVTKIVDGAVVPAENVSVSVGGTSQYYSDVRTGADGSYTIKGLAAGSYKIGFDDYGSGLVSEYYKNAATVNTATSIAVGEQATVSGIDATLAQGSTISGTVTKVVDGAIVPAENVSVNVNGTGLYYSGAQTGADGSYTITGLAAGNYKVNFSAYGSGLVSEYYKNGATWSTATSIAVGEQATVSGIDATLAQGGTISGTVSQKLGGVPSAASGVSVTAYSADGHNDMGSAQTDADGRYSIDSLPAGSFRLQFESRSSGGPNVLSEWWDNAADFNSATPIEVTPGATASGKDATLAQGSTISGTVTKVVDGAIVPAENVSVSIDGTGPYYFGARTGADGSYTITGLPAGNYKVGFNAFGSGLVSEYYKNAATWSTATSIAVGEQATVSSIDATLAQGGTISGTVSQEPGGPAASGVSVTAYSADGRDYMGAVTTDTDGHYSINSLPTGSFRLQFESRNSGGPNVLSEWWDNASDFDSATPIEVTAGATVSGKDATLAQGSTISGTVTKSVNGVLSPAANVSITAYGASDGSYAGNTSTDDDGMYSLDALSAGGYKLGFSTYGSGLANEYYDDASDLESAKVINVAAQSTVAGIDASLAQGSTISGVVTKDIGGTVTPDSNAYVTAYSAAGAYVGGTETAADGSYSIEDLTAGNYALQFSDWGSGLAPEYFENSSSLTSATLVSVGSEPVSGINSTLELGGTINGTVTKNVAGAVSPGTGVPVTLYDVSGKIVEIWQADADGEYAFGSLSAGSYKVGFATYSSGSSSQGLVGEFFDNAQDLESAQLIEVAKSATVSGINAELSDTALPPVTGATPTITGTTTAGQTLTAAAGSWTPGTVELAYQWSRAGTAITGATAATYLLVPADVGQTLTVTVTGAKTGYITASKTSTPTAAIAAAPKPFTAAPVPTISGTTTAGQTLTAAAGPWTPTPATVAYQWSRAGTAITGATAATYLLVPADEGQTITVTVTASNVGYITTAKTSTPTAAIAAAPKAFTAAPVPTISGTTTEGQTLTAAAGSWTPGTVELAYQWSRAGTAITGATTATYLLIPADVGQTLTVTVTGAKTGYITASKTSTPTATIAAAPKPFTAAPVPTINGTTTAGQTLTAAAGPWTPTPAALAYQWSRAGTAITGATAATYLLVPADVGQTLTVTVTASNVGYITTSKTSTPTATIAAAPKPFTAAPVPTISGTTKVGLTLTAASGTWGPATATLAYQWKRAGVAITGATAKTYLVTETDFGRTLTVSVTGTQTGYISQTKSSSATAAIAAGALTTTPVPTITGTLKGGNVLTANAGTWAPTAVTLAYQWYRSGVKITGATAKTFTLTATDVGQTMKVTVTGSKTGYATAAKTSVATAAITTGTLTSAVPTVAGTAKVGSLLTAAAGTWGPGTVTLKYQWYRSGVAITGATATTYTLAAADQTKTMTVKVYGSKSGATSVTKASVSTAAVLAGTLTAPTPKITGTLKSGSTLTASPGTWGPGTVTLKYQWYRSGVAITGATLKTYALVYADRFDTIKVRVVGTKTGYTSVTKYSASTVKIP